MPYKGANDQQKIWTKARIRHKCIYFYILLFFFAFHSLSTLYLFGISKLDQRWMDRTSIDQTRWNWKSRCWSIGCFMLIFFVRCLSFVYIHIYDILIPVARFPSWIPTPLSKYSKNQSLEKTDVYIIIYLQYIIFYTIYSYYVFYIIIDVH